MMENGRKFLCMLALVIVLFCVSRGEAAEQASALLPADLVMQDGFKPGFGVDVGLVQRTTDGVVLIHAQDMVGYWAKINLPVFMKDAIITPTDGRAILLFEDESTVAISADTKLVINRSIYDPDKKERSSFLGMTVGKARFFIKKLPGFAHSEFKVKTKTLVAGVRGSDFVIEAYQDHTVVSTLGDTELELTRLAVPEEVTVLHSFERIRISEGEAPSAIEKITPVEADSLKKELPLPAKGAETVGTMAMETGTKETKGVTEQGPATETAPLLNVQQETILLSGDELVDPIPPINIVEQTPVPEIIEESQFTDMEQAAENQQEDIQEEVAEDTYNQAVEVSPLPDMPGPPQ